MVVCGGMCIPGGHELCAERDIVRYLAFDARTSAPLLLCSLNNGMERWRHKNAHGARYAVAFCTAGAWRLGGKGSKEERGATGRAENFMPYTRRIIGLPTSGQNSVPLLQLPRVNLPPCALLYAHERRISPITTRAAACQPLPMGSLFVTAIQPCLV